MQPYGMGFIHQGNEKLVSILPAVASKWRFLSDEAGLWEKRGCRRLLEGDLYARAMGKWEVQ